ncbi:DNA-binding transcriptional regulator, AcrR family [Asanoa hainanensis]|uniref:DNA-binding transcriptional regulator, AcrR family n=1 Tax=Asanoa hainanensis TaxID=560556 RepID=A0A239N032_9ACTN|nr:TetR/AcrR family transcriptional regulator [Asanoa hainanensis]SNT48387.1 DNA-binding transcriptional regulator, AcrR family [Asanoa hainanensis]
MAGPRTADAPERVRDSARTRAEILDVATAEFAANGYDGSRVDEIAALTRTTKRMIYYHFGGKKQLYIAVLERAYARIRAAERQVDLEDLNPVDAVRRVAEVTFDHHGAHPEFIRLVSIENIHNAEHVKELVEMVDLGGPIVALLEDILRRGRQERLFHADADAVDVHMMISAFCVFRVANRHTFGTIFGRDLVDPTRTDHYRAMCGDLIVRYLTADPTSTQPPARDER